MSLITYEDARPWARSIKDKVTRPDGDPADMPEYEAEFEARTKRATNTRNNNN